MNYEVKKISTDANYEFAYYKEVVTIDGETVTVLDRVETICLQNLSDQKESLLIQKNAIELQIADIENKILSINNL